MRNPGSFAGFVLVGAFLLTGCERGTAESVQDTAVAEKPPVSAEARDAVISPPTVDVVVRDFVIDAPEEISTGWTNFRLVNQGQQPHFVLMYRLPEGKTIEDQKREVVPAFDAVMAALTAGEIEKAQIGEFLGARMPEWTFLSQYRGGPGLLSPGRTGETVVLLDQPGTYLLECYVKAPDGTFHTSMGMLAQVNVVDGGNDAPPPQADATVVLANRGLEAPGSLSAGKHVVRVIFADDPPAALPYDVHLARLHDGADMNAVAQWMDWSNIGGLAAPAPVEFLGGAENTPAGNEAYVTVNLEPGRYAWISEINAQQMMKEFVVE